MVKDIATKIELCFPKIVRRKFNFVFKVAVLKFKKNLKSLYFTGYINPCCRGLISK